MACRIWASLVLAAVAMVGGPPRLAQASTAVVPDDFPTVQQALDAADTVLVRGGTYPERPRLEARFAGPRLLSRHPASAERPRLTGAVLAAAGGDPPVRLEGFEVGGRVELNAPDYLAQFEIDACVLDSGLFVIPYGDYVTLRLSRSRVLGDIGLRAVDVFAILESDTVRAGRLSLDVQHVIASVTGCVFEGPGFAALDVDAGPGRMQVRDNRITGYGVGLRSRESELDLEIERNVIAHCDQGMDIAGNTVSIHANEISNCGVGIHIPGPGVGNDVGRRITDNRVLGSTGVGIHVSDEACFTFVERNVVGRSGGHGFVIETVSYGNDPPPGTIRNNTSYGNQGSGFVLSHETIDVLATTPPGMTRNIAYGNGGHGLEWSSTGAYPETPLANLDHTCNDWYANALGSVTGTPVSPLDLELDPRFCDVGSDSVSLQAGSPLLHAAGCGLIGARGMGCASTATAVSLFAAERSADGVRVRWRLPEPGAGDDVSIERAERASGPWARVVTERIADGEATVDLDRDVLAGRGYWYRLVAASGGVAGVLAGPIEVAAWPLPGFALEPIAPAPVHGPAQVSFTTGRQGAIDLRVLDVQGRSVAAIAGGVWPAGRHVVEWVPGGGTAAAGIYFVRFRYPGGESTRRVVVLP